MYPGKRRTETSAGRDGRGYDDRMPLYGRNQKYGGGGYPDGLSGNDIPEEARIIAVADAYDAMSSRRSYRDVLPQEVVRGEIEKGKGTQFDPKFADIMLSMIDEDTEYTMKEADYFQSE